MKWNKLALVFALLGALAAADAAWAHGRHHHGRWHGHIGIVFGAPLVWHWPYYSYPPVIVRPAPPPVYIEQGRDPAPAWWYYCEEAKGYYPYVRECPGGWRKVPPSPPE